MFMNIVLCVGNWDYRNGPAGVHALQELAYEGNRHMLGVHFPAKYYSTRILSEEWVPNVSIEVRYHIYEFI